MAGFPGFPYPCPDTQRPCHPQWPTEVPPPSSDPAVRRRPAATRPCTHRPATHWVGVAVTCRAAPRPRELLQPPPRGLNHKPPSVRANSASAAYNDLTAAMQRDTTCSDSSAVSRRPEARRRGGVAILCRRGSAAGAFGKTGFPTERPERGEWHLVCARSARMPLKYVP